jgi:hypothetical protein
MTGSLMTPACAPGRDRLHWRRSLALRAHDAPFGRGDLSHLRRIARRQVLEPRERHLSELRCQAEKAAFRLRNRLDVSICSRATRKAWAPAGSQLAPPGLRPRLHLAPLELPPDSAASTGAPRRSEDTCHVRITMWAVSSMAEQVPFKHKVTGSSPVRPTADPRTNARFGAGFPFHFHDHVPNRYMLCFFGPLPPLGRWDTGLNASCFSRSSSAWKTA